MTVTASPHKRLPTSPRATTTPPSDAGTTVEYSAPAPSSVHHAPAPSAHYNFYGRPYTVTAAIIEISPTALLNGCQDDAAPGKTNVNFTVTVHNDQSDRSALAPGFTVGTIAKTAPTETQVDVGSANIYQTDGDCSGASYGPQGENLPPGGSYTFPGQITGIAESDLATTDLGIMYMDDADTLAIHVLHIPLRVSGSN